MSDPILFERDGGIARIRFNRPAQLNAVDLATSRAFLDACRRVASDPEVRVVLLSGEGKAFGAGGDLNELADDPVAGAPRLIEPVHDAIKLIAELDVPFVASVHGIVAGGSLSLAMACDIVVAAEGTRFNLSYVKIGATCDGSATWSLPRLVGTRNALGIALLGQTFDAAEAYRMGMLNLVVPVESLEATSREIAERLARGPTRAIGAMKRLIRTSFERSLPDQLDAERDRFVENVRTEDFRAGIAAFLDKRTPVFRGR